MFIFQNPRNTLPLGAAGPLKILESVKARSFSAFGGIMSAGGLAKSGNVALIMQHIPDASRRSGASATFCRLLRLSVKLTDFENMSQVME